MNNLTRFETTDGIELVIDTETGESFATVSGYARMVGLTKQAISKRLKGVNSVLTKTAELITAGGIQAVNLLSEELICDKFGVYY